MDEQRLQAFIRDIYSDRQQLRNKLQRLIRQFNGGSTVVKRYGISVDVLNELEGIMAKATDGEIAEALRILRE